MFVHKCCGKFSWLIVTMHSDLISKSRGIFYRHHEYFVIAIVELHINYLENVKYGYLNQLWPGSVLTGNDNA